MSQVKPPSQFLPSPQTTLVILLGASAWPHTDLASSPAFARSAKKVSEYFCDRHRFGLPSENFLDLFDKKQSSPMEVAGAIDDFLNERITKMKQAGTPARDLFFYYIGHGMFDSNDQGYCLAIGCTSDKNLIFSAIPMAGLRNILMTRARHLRRLLILDCCFAAAAYQSMQSAPDQAAIQQAISTFEEKRRGTGFPERGTTLLCSSSHKAPSLLMPDGSGTMFSEALVRALSQGNQQKSRRLSLYDLQPLIQDALNNLPVSGAPRPEVHSPDQSQGDIANIPLFPNLATVKAPDFTPPGSEELNITARSQTLYRQIVEERWANKRLDKADVAHLTKWARDFKLSQEEAASIEQAVMGKTKERILASQPKRPWIQKFTELPGGIGCVLGVVLLLMAIFGIFGIAANLDPQYRTNLVISIALLLFPLGIFVWFMVDIILNWQYLER